MSIQNISSLPAQDVQSGFSPMWNRARHDKTFHPGKLGSWASTLGVNVWTSQHSLGKRNCIWPFKPIINTSKQCHGIDKRFLCLVGWPSLMNLASGLIGGRSLQNPPIPLRSESSVVLGIGDWLID